MGVRLAALLTLIGVVGLSVGIGLFDYRAGIVCFSLLAGAVGVWHLLQE